MNSASAFTVGDRFGRFGVCSICGWPLGTVSYSVGGKTICGMCWLQQQNDWYRPYLYQQPIVRYEGTVVRTDWLKQDEIKRLLRYAWLHGTEEERELLIRIGLFYEKEDDAHPE